MTLLHNCAMLVRMSQHNARALGAGEFDIAAVVRAIRATGTQVPWSIEAPSTVGWANPEVHIAALATGMRKFM
jgi:sugar phosphate isomerase/epimerase